MSTKKVKTLKAPKICRDAQHDIPSMVVYEPGVYEHLCPRCKQKIRFTVHKNTM